MKNLTQFSFVGLCLVFIGLLSFEIDSQRKNALNKHINHLLAGKSTVTVELDKIIPEKWHNICFVKGNYNIIKQSELDSILGGHGLINVDDLAFDGADTYVVTFLSKPTVRRYSKVRIVAKEFVICSDKRKQKVVLENHQYGIKELIF